MRPGHDHGTRAVAPAGRHGVGQPPTRPGLRHHLRGRTLTGRGLGGLSELQRLDAVVLQLVEPRGEPFGQPPRVREHDGGAVRLDEVEHAFLDVRPDRGAAFAAGRRAGVVTVGLAELRHVLDRDDHGEVPLLAVLRLDDRDLAATGEERRHLVDRAHGGGQTDALCNGLADLLAEGVEPLEGHGQVRAALGAGDGVHLVDDHGVDATQRLPRLRGQQQEQRLGRGDEDVRGAAVEHPAFVGRGVAGAHADRDVGLGEVERRAEVALDVDREGLQRADVEHPAPAAGVLGDGRRRQPVERGQERGEGLAGAGGRDDQGVVAAGDRLPRAALGLGGAGEGTVEPGLGGRPEPVSAHAVESAPTL